MNTAGIRRGSKSARDSITSISVAANSASSSLAQLGLGLGLAAGVKSLVTTGSDLEQSLAGVKAVTGATSAEFAKLSTQAEKLGASTEYTAAQVADAQGALSRAGFKVNETLAATPGLLQLATAGELDLATAASVAAAAVNQFGIKANETARIADVLALGANSADTSVADLGQQMTYVGSLAKSAGISFESTTAALAALSTRIGKDKAGRALRGIFSKLAKPSAEGVQALDRLKLKFTDLEGNIKPLPRILDEFNAKLAGMASGEKLNILGTIFDTQSASAFAALLDGGGSSLAALTTKLENSEGTAKRIADIKLDTLQGDFKLLGSAVDGVKISLFNAFSSKLRQLTQKATAFISGPFLDALEDAKQAAMNGESVIAGFVKSLTGFDISKVVELAAAFVKVRVAMLGVSVAMNVFKRMGALIALVANPIGLVVAGIALIATVAEAKFGFVSKSIAAIREKWDLIGPQLVDSFTAVFDAIKGIVGGAIDFILGLFGTSLDDLGDGFSTDGLASGLLDLAILTEYAFKNVGDTLSVFFVSVVSDLQGALFDMATYVGAVVTDTAKQIKNSLTLDSDFGGIQGRAVDAVNSREETDLEKVARQGLKAFGEGFAEFRDTKIKKLQAASDKAVRVADLKIASKLADESIRKQFGNFASQLKNEFTPALFKDKSASEQLAPDGSDPVTSRVPPPVELPDAEPLKFAAFGSEEANEIIFTATRGEDKKPAEQTAKNTAATVEALKKTVPGAIASVGIDIVEALDFETFTIGSG
jgi:TP901 family phage tail tape measure protein